VSRPPPLTPTLPDPQDVEIHAVQAFSDNKTKFIDYLSHETRNSLTTVVATAESALHSSPDDPHVVVPRADLEDIVRAAGAAARVVSDVLILEKAEQGKLEMEGSPFAVSSLLKFAQRR
jgi:signal transduction histidine kinase